jgi:glycine dehydrogenase
MPKDLVRTTPFMTQQIFNSVNSEHEMMRYINKLLSKDYTLMDGMIPLGSCTMKLNSAIVMMPITFPGFCNIHPFAPKD